MANYGIEKVAPPALPIPPESPLKRYLDDLNNILRLFFNRLANIVNLLSGEYGGRFISVPNGLFFSTTNQAISVINTGQLVVFENTYLSNGVTINGGTSTQITVEYSGIYNFQFSAQPTSTSASSKVVYVWLARDGVDIGYTAKEFVLQGSSDVKNMTYNFNLDMQAGQYLELKWSSNDINAALTAQTAATPHPGMASAVVTVTYVSTLPDELPTPP